MSSPWSLLLALACFALVITATLHATMSTAHGQREFAFPQMAMVDFLHTAIIGVAVLAVTYGPAMLVLMAAGESRAGAVVALLLLPWAVFYGPMAYLLAATTQSLGEVIQPQIGFKLMAVFGSGLYKQLLLVFGGLTLALWLVTFSLSYVPFLVYPILAPIQVYCSIASGAAVGIAADKRAQELGMD